MKMPIYMDCHATTPLDPRVLDAMLPVFSSDFGNAASATHIYGTRAANLVESARENVARLIHANAEEIVFTSGATESNNLAIKGVFSAYQGRGNHFITQVTEHKAVLDTLKELERQGAKVTFLGVDSYGQIRLEELRAAITDQTLLISIMFANHEIGTTQPITEIGKIAKEKNVLFHVDAAQAAGKVGMDVGDMKIDLLSLSAHKFYGPKGVGALYVRKNNPHVRLSSLFHGGGQENGVRSGTLNVPGIVGLGKACEIAKKELILEASRIAQLRDRLKNQLESGLSEVRVNGHPTQRLPGNLHISIPGVDGGKLIHDVAEKVAVSSGSACSSHTSELSHVMKAIGADPVVAQASLRFGIGRFNTEEEIDFAAARVVHVVKKLSEKKEVNYGNSTH